MLPAEPNGITVSAYMTPSPHGIAPQETLATARSRLREYRIRHLPVRVGGRVVGLLAERDVDLLAGTAGVDPHAFSVERAMTPDPFCVPADAPIDAVAAEMAARRIGSALVVDGGGHLLGIFTEVDALRALAQLAKA